MNKNKTKNAIATTKNVVVKKIVAVTDNLIATGMAVLAGCEMLGFNFGTAVKVRQGVNKK